MAVLSLLAGTSILAISLLALRYFLRSQSSLPHPPGPTPLPVVGNALQLPTSRAHVVFKEWAEQYGDVIYVTVFGKPMIILNSSKAIWDILEKRAAAYGGRPRMVMAGELLQLGDSVAMVDNMEKHKLYRKLFNKALNPRASQEYWPSQMKESRLMMARLLATPEELVSHVQRTVIAVIFLISHGYQIERNDDHYVWLANKVMRNFNATAAPGAYLVDVLPFLRHVPEWLPGAKFKREAKAWRSEWFELRRSPFELVKQQMAAGKARPSFTSRLLDEAGSVTGDVHEEDLIMWASGSMSSAGADTSVSAIQTFYLAMMQYPEVQIKAQKELDEVVGRDRMPTFEDKPRLVFCTAILKEVLRWQPVAPLAIPHTVHEDDTYNGWTIPKGSMIIANVWATMNDPTVYPQPEKFIPERFFSADGKIPQNPDGVVRDIGSFCFGFGRRICPGANVAEATVFMAIVNTLWAFNISKPMGRNGKPIEPDMEYIEGVVSHPKDFACDIKPRSLHAANVVRQAAADYTSLREDNS